VILLLYAHPHPQRSVAGRALLSAVSDLPQLVVRSLYDLYPDFAVDAEAERRALSDARLVIWQGPLYWYGVPALMKLWWEDVLVRGWAYGEGGNALEGKDCLWVTTTGALSDAYNVEGKHGHPIDAFVPAIEQTARFCGMRWQPPIIVHGAHRLPSNELEATARAYRRRLDEWLKDHG
jgi:glutathione-regulated potassium-efflux system ancillary protein KefF